MSHVTTMDGLQPNPVTIKAIIAMLTPNESQAVHQGLLITWQNSTPNLAASPNFNATSAKRTCRPYGQQGTSKPLIQQKC